MIHSQSFPIVVYMEPNYMFYLFYLKYIDIYSNVTRYLLRLIKYRLHKLNYIFLTIQLNIIS